MTNMNLATLRYAHPLAFLAFLRKAGAPVGSYIRRQGLPVLCDDPGAYVPLRAAWGLFADAARREDQHIGWYAGKFVGDSNLSAPLLDKLDSAPTLHQALFRLTALSKTEASHLQLWVQKIHSGVLFCTQYPGMKYQPGYLESQGYQIGVYIDLIRHFTGEHWSPGEIGIEASLVPASLRERFPNCRIRLNQRFGYIHISHSSLYKGLSSPHRGRGREHRLVDTTRLNFAETLTLLVEPHLAEGYPNMQFAASLIGTSKRTLARRLDSCGERYQLLVDKLRFEKASTLLQSNDESIAEISRLVGFRDQANFTRMFQRITGISPMQFRQLKERITFGPAQPPGGLQ